MKLINFWSGVQHASTVRNEKEPPIFNKLIKLKFTIFFGLLIAGLTANLLIFSPVKAQINPEARLMLNFVHGSQARFGANNLGPAVELYVRFNRLLGCGMLGQVNLNFDESEKWVQFFVTGDIHLLDKESPLDAFVGLGLGDSIFSGQHGVSLMGRAGAGYWMTSHFGAVFSAGGVHVFKVNLPGNESFSSFFTQAGIKFKF